MKIGKNLWTGSDWHLTSWRSSSDPLPGRFPCTTDTRRGVPENVLWDGDVERYRTGPWNGVSFSGVPEMTTYSDMFRYELTVSSGEVTYGYVAKPGAPPFSRLLLTDDGVVQCLVWDATTRAWKSFFQGPRDICDAYGKCGAFGVCDAGAASTSFCGCAAGFSPASPAEWKMRDTSSGCRRDVALDCAGDGTTTKTTDGFLRLRGVKLPDTSNATVDMSGIELEECGARCLGNCSCVAYAPADIAGGGAGSSCIMWTDGLVDLRSVDGGQDIYLRLAKSELELAKPQHQPFRTKLVIGASIASSLVVILTVILAILFVITRCPRPRISAAHSIQPIPAPTVPSVELSSMKAATKDFHGSNIIGRGGFGIVYEGNLSDGKKVAIKRLIIQPSHTDDEGEKAFDRELELMSKLRHGNLVQLLAYCKDGNERLLV
ncbi:hypothetical protein HU200_057692 [Digitaria exilis]|uniref:Uncharacterized protein n=1 Tax=Digitaria exilis TaxID=1010633 RepID=A0A835AK57_9POAL|nr:hypothetical protein HU200_057692 [Digitaria exilis]